MGNQQYEFGAGRVYNFVASANTTSGVLVYMDGGQVRPTTAASQHAMGISLIPASAGKPVSVMIEGVANLLISGAAIVAGDLLGSFAGGTATERTHSNLNERRLDVGIAFETIANATRGKVKLLW
jgi:hypothetical protein